MAIRRPLIIDNGRVKELPAGDSLDAAETVVRYAVPVVSSGSNTVFVDDEMPELVTTQDGDIVMALVTEDNI